MAETIRIGGRLHSTATGNIVTGANEVFDDSKGKKQSEINEELSGSVNGKEDKSNKVTSITSGSTDTQYASAKAVYTEVDKKADKSTVDSLENKVNTKTTFHSGAFNAGNITEEGWYDEITSGRPSGSDDVGGTETYILYMSSSGSQICFSKKYSGKAYSRITKNDAWKRLDNSNVRDSGYGADNITEEGWYDNVNLTRPEGSESDEKYYLYHSANGGQICFSRRNSGKAYQRLGIGHQWAPLTHDDYSIENPLAALYKSCTLINTYENSSISYHTSDGYGYDSLTNLTEYYAGNNNETTNFHISVGLNGLKPNDIIRVRCVYRRGFSAEGVNTYPYDSDAYMFVSKSIDSTNHSIANNESNWNKIKSMGGQNFPFTDGEKGWQDLAFMRDRFFDEDYEYSWHYIRVTAPQIGEDSGSTPGNYLHIYGDFTKPGSWFVFDKAEVYRASNNIYYSNIDLSQIPEGTLSGDVVTQLNKLRNDVLNANTKIVVFGFENAEVESKSIYASISNNSNTFGVMISLGGSAMGLEYNYSSETWESTSVTFEQISNKVTSITSGSTDTQYPSAKAVYTNVSAKYTKPSTGIPKTDLASAIQTSLGKADTAVQPSDITSKENTSNKVTSISSGSTDTQYPSAKAVYTNVSAKYTKPSGGIPKSDLDSSVQESLDKANSAATQSYVDEIANSTELVLLDGEVFPIYVLQSPTTYSWGLKNEDLYTYYDIESGGKLFGFLACSLNNTDYKIDIKAVNSSNQINLTYINLPDALSYYLSQPYISRPATTYGHGRINIPVDSIQSGDSLTFKGLYLYRVPQYVFEESKNKVTLIASDNTDEQYPSAKSVYTSVSVKYTKPYDGIPKTDLESTVQSSLDNADTAVQPSELYTYVNNCEYDNVTHEIRLLNGSRTIATIDASEFIIDGMISNVTISGTNLVITFNTISGSTQTISIPIADIFQPDNYYTKDEIDKIAYYSNINTEDITEGEITGTTKTELQRIRGNSGDAKFVVIGTSENTSNRTGVVATIDSYGSEFQMWFVDKNRLCQITATPDDSYWSAHWETLATETYVNDTLPKEISTASERVVMRPNNLYKLGVRGALEVVFRQGNPGYVNEYMFEFTSNTDSFSLTVPSGVKWLYEPEITSGNTYQVSILNNLAVIAEWVNE